MRVTVQRVTKPSRSGIWISVKTERFVDEDLRQIQLWCIEHRCGKRMSFDLFRFASEEQLTMFMLRWSQ